MGKVLQDVWLPEVEAEYFALLSHSRDVGSDVGNQFRAFEEVLDRGVDAAWRPIAFAGAARIYVMYAKHALMFFAVRGTQAAVMKWMVLGTEHQQREGLLEAKARALQLFR